MEKKCYIARGRDHYWHVFFKKPKRHPNSFGGGWDAGLECIYLTFNPKYKCHLPKHIQNMDYKTEPKEIIINFDFGEKEL